jgi:hypothetical protein
MPLTEFQRDVARLIAKNRKPESHVAGGAVINREESALRISNDLDIFQDAAEIVAAYAEADERLLREAGYSVEWETRNYGFFRAIVGRGGDSMRLDWVSDAVYRFFPAETDPDFGYCLHQADLATNKVLALVGRSEIRDFLDILQLDREYLSLGAIIWAACGKDQGYTPSLILDLTNRHARYRESDLEDENLVRPVDLKELKQQWLSARERAETLFAELPPDEIGCLYIDPDRRTAVTPDPGSPEFSRLIRHGVSVGGAWPGIN